MDARISSPKASSSRESAHIQSRKAGCIFALCAHNPRIILSKSVDRSALRASSSATRRKASPQSAVREWLVAVSGGLTLAFTAWGLGGVQTWTLHTLFAGGLLTLICALLPWPSRNQRSKIKERSRVVHAQGASASDPVLGASSTENDRSRGTPSSRSLKKGGGQPSQSSLLRHLRQTSVISHHPSSGKAVPPSHIQRSESSISNPAKRDASSPASAANAKRLLRWPPFWFSFLFLLYLLIGALNPAAEIVRDERGWWVEAIQAPLPTWLPTSVRSDYQPMNAWRVLASFTAAFTLMWGLWAGLTRRKAVLLTLWMFLLSGAAMGFVAILQHLTEADAVLWTFPSSNKHFWGSFFYRNQGAAFLNLVLVAAGVLFFYHAKKSRERARSGGPHFLCFLLFALVATSVGLALSRGGILFAGILSVAFLSLVAIYALQSLAHLSSLWSALIPLALILVGLFALIRYIDLDAIEQRFGDIGDRLETADQDARYFSSKATWDMAQDRLSLGWGAGSFRYIFPMYQREYPEIYYRTYWEHEERWVGHRMYRYAHNDLLQFVAEYGLIGSGLVLLTLLWILFSAFRSFSLSAFFMLVGFATSMSHAALDFIFNSPAYWLAFVGLIAATAKLLQLEAERRSSAV